MLTYQLCAATPVLAVSDVDQTAAWYREILGFEAHLFPDTPPSAFGILVRQGTEIMLRRLQEGEQAPRPSVAWDVYVRVTGNTLLGLWEALRERVEVVEPLCRQFYGDTEFTIRDCDGRMICLSELLPQSA